MIRHKSIAYHIRIIGFSIVAVNLYDKLSNDSYNCINNYKKKEFQN